MHCSDGRAFHSRTGGCSCAFAGVYSPFVAGIISVISKITADLLFPPQCALCDAGGTPLCDPCAEALQRADGQRCHRCWMPLGAAAICRHCIDVPPAFSSIRAAYVMEGGARRLAHELKYEGLTSLAAPMARLMHDAVEVSSIDVVAAVPLHRGRERSRGYNQAHELARHLAALVALPCDSRALRRTRDTEPLAKTMHREERRAIVAGAFAAPPERVEGRRVLLVDDVVTTGATLDACARTLLDAGAAEVRCATWARAD
jgi:ComF family protein